MMDKRYKDACDVNVACLILKRQVTGLLIYKGKNISVNTDVSISLAKEVNDRIRQGAKVLIYDLAKKAYVIPLISYEEEVTASSGNTSTATSYRRYFWFMPMDYDEEMPELRRKCWLQFDRIEIPKTEEAVT